MNSRESPGESSSCRQENGAASSDPDRPHKKARFPWQVKGKHHLKNQTNEETKKPAATPVEPEPIQPPESATSMSSTDRNNVSVLSSSSTDTNRQMCQGSGRPAFLPDGSPLLPLRTVIELAESVLMRSMACSNSYDTTRDAINTLLEQDLDVVPRSPTYSAKESRRLKRAEDNCIAQWQATQNVRGCFDNTVNSVLDAWITDSHPDEERSVALGLARIMNNIPPDDDNVENEGILMAINAHGLQNVPIVAGIPLFAPSEQLARTLASNIPICEDSDSDICSEDYEYARECCSPWLVDEPDTRNLNQNQGETDNAVHPWRQIHDNGHANQPTPPQYRDNRHNTTGEDYEFEFMNTAVIQAIKSKGLMAACTDFG